jgi:sterol desaturase/sphingolipid hydroxylase (fatty acid hydroxylase superfamily)
MIREQWDKNYGNILIIWDRLLGTWYHGAVVSDNRGLAENRYNSGSAVKDLWVGTRDFFVSYVILLISVDGEWIQSGPKQS